MRSPKQTWQKLWLAVGTLGFFAIPAIAAWTEKSREHPSVHEVSMPVGEVASADVDQAEATTKSRTFRLVYGATVTDLPAGKVARIWLPVPPSDPDQDAELVAKQLPAEGRIRREPKFGNQILYLESRADAGRKLRLSGPYRVARHEVPGKSQNPIHNDE